MIEFRHRCELRTDVQLDDQKAAQLLAMVAHALQPGLEQSVDAVDWERDGQRGCDWTAEGFLPDGLLLCIILRPTSREFTLFITNELRQPTPHRAWHTFAFIGFAILGLCVGIRMHSVLWAALTTVGGLGAWLIVDIAHQILAERRIERRGINADHWRQRFEDVIESASRALAETRPQ